ncbi:MAG: hypothetical protein CMF61_00760 [Magnetococcales bacterium]|nr:hypothetical protein [Magnetococcales bacterium]PPR18574.1 MAG: hypothetical protein CFH43_00463 [Pseudomonadota bacterium]
MNPVTLQTLEDLDTLNKETLYVLFRFYLNVDRAIPSKFLPVLLGVESFSVEYPPVGFKESLNHFIAHFLSGIGIVPSAATAYNQGRFMVQDSAGKLYITQATRQALSLFIRQFLDLNGALPKAVIYTNAEWENYKINSHRYGDWDGF